jgi:Ca2+/H+ antiporter, TMEM165/GDT1 family
MSLMMIFVISFGLIFVAELGDKTQLMVFTLALRYGGRPVLAGAVLAFAFLSGSAAVLGKELGELISPDIITRISAWVFILFGAYMLMLSGDTGEVTVSRPSAKTGFVTAFSLIAVSEMGDKTQIATLLLSIKYQNFMAVFLGSLAALSLASLLGILVAGRLHSIIPARYITPASGILFVLLGLGALLLA